MKKENPLNVVCRSSTSIISRAPLTSCISHSAYRSHGWHSLSTWDILNTWRTLNTWNGNSYDSKWNKKCKELKPFLLGSNICKAFYSRIHSVQYRDTIHLQDTGNDDRNENLDTTDRMDGMDTTDTADITNIRESSNKAERKESIIKPERLESSHKSERMEYFPISHKIIHRDASPVRQYIMESLYQIAHDLNINTFEWKSSETIQIQILSQYLLRKGMLSFQESLVWRELFQVDHKSWKKIYQASKYKLNKSSVRVTKDHIQLLQNFLETNQFDSSSGLYHQFEKLSGLSRAQVRNLVAYARHKNVSVALNRKMKSTIETIWRRHMRDRELNYGIESGNNSITLYDILEKETQLPRSQLREQVKYLRRKYKMNSSKNIQQMNLILPSKFGKTRNISSTMVDNTSSNSLKEEDKIENNVPPPPNYNSNPYEKLLERPNTSKNPGPSSTNSTPSTGSQKSPTRIANNPSHSISKSQTKSNLLATITAPSKQNDFHKRNTIPIELRNRVKQILLDYDHIETSRKLYNILERETGLPRKQLYTIVHSFRKMDL